jgi:hypothetical protein
MVQVAIPGELDVLIYFHRPGSYCPAGWYYIRRKIHEIEIAVSEFPE